MNANQLLENIINGDVKTLSRVISLVENEQADELLRLLPFSNKKIIGITGPPGAGKSTLADGLIEAYVNRQKKVGVVCIDPSSAFNHGALLGDRIRMNAWYNNPNVFIRSLASRGNMDGLHPSIIEITDVMKAAPFDVIIVETVGVGQTEIEIASLADTTVVVLVPEAGDDIQTMKAGLMEIADVFVVNKADRPQADIFVKNLLEMMAPVSQTRQNIPVVKTVASEKKGIVELMEKIELHEQQASINLKKNTLLADKAYKLIQHKKMKNISKTTLINDLDKAINESDFNLYRFADNY